MQRVLLFILMRVNLQPPVAVIVFPVLAGRIRSFCNPSASPRSGPHIVSKAKLKPYSFKRKLIFTGLYVRSNFLCSIWFRQPLETKKNQEIAVSLHLISPLLFSLLPPSLPASYSVIPLSPSVVVLNKQQGVVGRDLHSRWVCESPVGRGGGLHRSPSVSHPFFFLTVYQLRGQPLGWPGQVS